MDWDRSALGNETKNLDPNSDLSEALENLDSPALFF